MNRFTAVFLILLLCFSFVYAQKKFQDHSIGAAPVVKSSGNFVDKTFLIGENAFGIDAGLNFFGSFSLNNPSLTTNIAPNPGSATSFANAGAFNFGGDLSKVYYLDDENAFFEIDTSTGTTTSLPSPVPTVGGQTWAGMAFDPTDGSLYGVTTDITTSYLWIIDPATGGVTLVGNINSPGVIDVCVDGLGDMYAYDLVTDSSLTIDKSTGAGTVLGALAYDANFGQGMAWEPTNEVVYLSAFNATTFQAELRILDRTTGSTSLVGAIGTPGTSQWGWMAIPGQLGDDLDPKPPTNFAAYSDYTTPTSMNLTWTDPAEYVNGDPLTNFQIIIARDAAIIDSVAMGTETYTDAPLTDGQSYVYDVWAKDNNDSSSSSVSASWYAGGSPFPAPPENLLAIGTTTDATLTWTDPTTQSDGTPLDDLDSIYVYRDDNIIATVDAGVETYVDIPPPGFFYEYTVRAKDNETPPNLSEQSNVAREFVGTPPDYLVWVGPDIPTDSASALSADSIFAALVANGESAFLTDNLFDFGTDLNIFNAVFVVLGIYANNHVIGASDPEGPALETYLTNGGRVFLEGGDCFNFDPDLGGGYNIRPWFDLNAGSDGQGDVSSVVGLNDLSAFTFTYSGENNFMDELQPVNSTPVWQNSAVADIHGVFYAGFGTGRTIGVVPSFGGFDNSSAALNSEPRIVKGVSKVDYVIEDLPKTKINHENNSNFVKKAAYYPELKKQRKSNDDLFEYTSNGVRILANNKVDLMAAYLAFFTAPLNPPIITLSDTIYYDSLLVGGITIETLTIGNAGGSLGGDLTYSITENPAVGWLSVMPTSGTITTNQSENITLSFDATGLTAGDYTTMLDITSNDTANSLVKVEVNLNVNDAPVIRIEPDSLFFTLSVDSQDSSTFTIYNNGTGSLQVSIEDENVTSRDSFKPKWVQPQRPAVYYPKGEEPQSTNGEMIEGSGGPDPFGYRWIDSDEPNGPSYVFTDISGTGTLITFQPTSTLNPLDEGMATINMPFDVNFYGSSYNQLQVNTNGAVMFDMTFFDDMFSNVGIPSTDPPQLLVCPFWDDLDGRSGGSAYYQQDDGQFIIQWHNWGHYPSGTENMIFQVVFFQNSSTIWFVYENIDDQAQSTYGIENSDGTIGLEIAFNQVYAHNQLLTKIFLGAEWLTESPTGGTVAPGDSMEVWAIINSANLVGGTYLSNVAVNSNDPVNPTVKKPTVKLTVIGVPDIATTPDPLLLDTTFVNDTSYSALTVANTGNGVLNITNVTSTTSVFSVDITSFTVDPFNSLDLNVSFNPDSPGLETGWLLISSNDPDTPVDSVWVQGEAVLAPQIDVTPSAIIDSVAVNDSMNVTIQITNTASAGAAKLNWSASIGMSNSMNEESKKINIEFPASNGIAPIDPVKQSVSSQELNRTFAVLTGIESSVNIDVLLLTPDDNISDLEATLVAFSDLNVTIFPEPNLSTLSVSDLIPYDVVMTTNNTQWLGGGVDPVQVGDALADYIDAGGKVIVNNFAYDYAGWELAGRFITQQYGPFTQTTSDFTGTSNLGIIHEPGHPIMAGVSTLTNSYLWQNPGLASGAIRIADWEDGNLFLAANDNVVALNILPSDGSGNSGWAGDLAILYHNAIVWFSPGVSFIKLLEPTSGSIDPGDVQNLNVRIYGLDVVDSTYTANIQITSNDLVNPVVTIPVTIEVRDTVTSISILDPLPTTYAISHNYPNPFNPTTTIKYQLPQMSDVKLVIYNVLGQKVRTLINRQVEPGYHSAVWDGRNDSGKQVATGLYIYRFEASNFRKTMKMMLLK